MDFLAKYNNQTGRIRPAIAETIIMKKIVTLILSALLVVACSDVEDTGPKTLESGYMFCSTSETWEQINDAIVNSNNRMVSHLTELGYCGVLSEGLEYTILDRSITGTAHVRVWLGQKHFDIYTNNEATR
ncbi:hypothetical protein [Vibrio phage vB_VpaM_XM1]|uniref:Lipoprotein n=1 Tax=Vibrio phage PVP-XSN TaxID=3056214 RepID=A0AAX3Y3L7_9CAUD|nr:hypothetical protein PVP_XSN000011 [Vibrio phage PVP-XSN]